MKIVFSFVIHTIKSLLLILAMISMKTQANDREIMSMLSAVDTAVNNDLWIKSNESQQQSIEAQSIAAQTFADPKVSLGVANIAANNLSFDQEPMTQLRLGISQTLPRGKSRQLKKQQLVDIAASFPYQRQDRLMQLAVLVSHIWLDAYKAQKSIAFINKDRELFEQLVDAVEVSYTSSVGKTRQHDIIRSQLELIHLDDRITVITQQKDEALKKLNQWLSDEFTKQSSFVHGLSIRENRMVSSELPHITLDIDLSKFAVESEPFSQYLLNHPSIKALDQTVKASQTAVKLAKQKYKPEFSVHSSYGFRDNNPSGASRADLFSLGVTFDVPLFTKNKQDQEVKSAVLVSEAAQSEKLLLLRNMKANFEKHIIRLNGLNKRQKLYGKQLLPQMREQARASLTAYKNDDGDFSEAVRSSIALFNAEIDELDIKVEKLKTIIQLNYFLNEQYQGILDTQALQGDMK